MVKLNGKKQTNYVFTKKKGFIGSTPGEGKIQNDDQSQLVQIEKQVVIFSLFASQINVFLCWMMAEFEADHATLHDKSFFSQRKVSKNWYLTLFSTFL